VFQLGPVPKLNKSTELNHKHTHTHVIIKVLNNIVFYVFLVTIFIEKLPDCLLKGDDSDLEIDPCALSPDHSIFTSPQSNLKDHQTDALPQMEIILEALESKCR